MKTQEMTIALSTPTNGGIKDKLIEASASSTLTSYNWYKIETSLPKEEQNSSVRHINNYIASLFKMFGFVLKYEVVGISEAGPWDTIMIVVTIKEYTYEQYVNELSVIGKVIDVTANKQKVINLDNIYPFNISDKKATLSRFICNGPELLQRNVTSKTPNIITVNKNGIDILHHQIAYDVHNRPASIITTHPGVCGNDDDDETVAIGTYDYPEGHGGAIRDIPAKQMAAPLVVTSIVYDDRESITDTDFIVKSIHFGNITSPYVSGYLVHHFDNVEYIYTRTEVHTKDNDVKTSITRGVL